ncbi:MAG: pyridoxamine 5'-phosphate oxidase family protein [Candidatus Brocadiaceae bacterium]|nr:pyridoxamine 5'-phosphate oxidase family protein [Candidatus Brocadiaceae bacterium]
MGTNECTDGRTEMEGILRRESWGCLGLSSDAGPYVVPLNYAYVDGRILIHCALEGRKLDCIRADPRVCFVVARQESTVRDHGGSRCHLDCDSVLCTGTARIVEDLHERADALNAFNRAFKPGADDLAPDRVRACAVIEITVAGMTGRRERAGKRVRWAS